MEIQIAVLIHFLQSWLVFLFYTVLQNCRQLILHCNHISHFTDLCHCQSLSWMVFYSSLYSYFTSNLIKNYKNYWCNKNILFQAMYELLFTVVSVIFLLNRMWVNLKGIMMTVRTIIQLSLTQKKIPMMKMMLMMKLCQVSRWVHIHVTLKKLQINILSRVGRSRIK